MKLKVLADKVSLFRNVHKLKTADIYKRLTLDEKAIALVCYRCFIPVKWASLTPHLALDYYFMYYSLKLTGDEQFDFLKAVKNFSPMQWFHDPRALNHSCNSHYGFGCIKSSTRKFRYCFSPRFNISSRQFPILQFPKAQKIFGAKEKKMAKSARKLIVLKDIMKEAFSILVNISYREWT